MKKIGVDGCKGGGLAAVKDSTGKVRLEVYPTIGELWQTHNDADCIAIDIPIGLRGRGDSSRERLCDIEARQLLGQPRGSSVFIVPCREAIYAKTYDDASKINFECTHRKLSVFTWAIMPKIRELDIFLQALGDARKAFREIHPEVCFWALAKKKSMQHNKQKWIGTEERIGVMNSFTPDTRGFLLQVIPRFQKMKAEADDILDALAALVTIDGEDSSLRTLPDIPEADSIGLSMSMTYRLLQVEQSMPIDGIDELFFENTLILGELLAPDGLDLLPQASGVYIVHRRNLDPVTLAEENTGGWFHALPPGNFHLANANWIQAARVVYIGKAQGNHGLRGRVKKLIDLDKVTLQHIGAEGFSGILSILGKDFAYRGSSVLMQEMQRLR